jgi:hypothetical protein
LQVVIVKANVGFGETGMFAALEPVSRFQFSSRLSSGMIATAPMKMIGRNRRIAGGDGSNLPPQPPSFDFGRIFTREIREALRQLRASERLRQLRHI